MMSYSINYNTHPREPMALAATVEGRLTALRAVRMLRRQYPQWTFTLEVDRGT